MCVFEWVLPDSDVRINFQAQEDTKQCVWSEELWTRESSGILGSLDVRIHHGVIKMFVSSLHIIGVGVEGTLVGSDPKALSGITLISLPLWSLFAHSHCASSFSDTFSPALCLPFFFAQTPSLSAVLQQSPPCLFTSQAVLLGASTFKFPLLSWRVTSLAKSQWERKEITRWERRKETTKPFALFIN